MSIIHSRLPIEYFMTRGRGESNYGSGGIPYEGGSFDLALTTAGIHQVNIVKYTSMIPPEAKEITKSTGVRRFRFGSVCECIMSEMNGIKGQNIMAAILIAQIHDPEHRLIGSIVIEYGDFHDNVDKAMDTLFHQLNSMLIHRHYGKLVVSKIKMHQAIQTSKSFFILPTTFLYHSLKIKKKYGTVLVAVCFTKFLLR